MSAEQSYIIQIILSLMLIGLILIQVKGSGLGSAFGNIGAYSTRRGVEKVVFYLTVSTASTVSDIFPYQTAVLKLCVKKISLYLTVAVKFIQRYSLRLFEPKLPKAHYKRDAKSQALHLIKTHQRLLIGLAVFLFVLSLGGRVLEGAILQPEVSQGVIGLHSQDNLPPQVLALLSQPLIHQDNAGKPSPNLVESWQVNNDATLYTFKLKKDLVWADLTPLKSSDVSLQLKGAEVSYPDDETIQVKLTEGFSALPSLLTSPVLKQGSLMGAGPYKVVSSETNHSVITKLYLKSVSSEDNLSDLTINFYPDEKTAKLAYELGQVDSILGLSDQNEYKNTVHTRIREYPSNRLTAIFYNVKDPVLSDKNMRKALNSATPKLEGIERAKTSYPPTSWVYNESLKDPLGSMDLAKDYLSKVQAGKDSSITLTTTPNLEGVASLIVSSWKQAGIRAVLRVESGIPQNFQALLIIQPLPLDPDQYTLWHSTQTQTNVSKYSSQRADKDLEDGRKINDEKLRRESYLDLQKVIMDDVPVTPLYFAKTNVIYRKRVGESIQNILKIQFPH
jgi:peptide/nickel transport system substrate-binding protein